MGLQKNVASQKIAVYAYDTAADGPKTGDSANITAQISKDFAAAAATDDTNPTELDATDHPGIYVFDLTQAETNADNVLITAVSGTADIVLDPVQVFTVPPNFRALGIASDGDLTKVNTLDGHTPQTGDSYAVVNSGTFGNAAIKTQTAAIEVDTADIQGRLPAALTGDGNIKADTLRIGGTLQTANDVGGDVDAILVDTAEIGTAGAGLTNINLPNQTMDIVGNITGNVSGSVGSVTGAVGSVAGNVGGNVTGSVGSLATQAKADVNAEADAALLDVGVTTTVTGRIDAAVSTRASQTTLDTVDGIADAILLDTAEIGAAGAGLTAVPWNADWDAQVQSEVADALEETIADSIPADGTRPSVKQALYMLTQFMVERSVSSTTVTVKKPDGSTSLFTLTLDDATSPTSITRAS